MKDQDKAKILPEFSGHYFYNCPKSIHIWVYLLFIPKLVFKWKRNVELIQYTLIKSNKTIHAFNLLNVTVS